MFVCSHISDGILNSLFPWKSAQNRFSSILVVKKIWKWGIVGNLILNNFIICNIWPKYVFTCQEIKEILGKCPKLSKNVQFYCRYLFFNFAFFSVFFWIPITFRNFLVTLSSQFFDFLSYIAGKCIFVSQMPTNSEKNPKNVHFYCRYLFFNFAFFSVFFGFQLPLETFWWAYRAIFSIFCPIWQKNSFFFVSNIVHFC